MRYAVGVWPTGPLLLMVAVLEGAPIAAPPLPRGIPVREKAAACDILERYLRDVDGGRRAVHTGNAPVAFEIDAALPKLKTYGILRGLKLITGAYTQLSFVGDELIRTAVIARFLAAEAKGQSGREEVDIAPRNYRFHYRGISSYSGRAAFVFRTEPRSRRVGLFKGELWIDSETARPLREWGEFVKSPSVFLRHIYVVRDYDPNGADLHLRRMILRFRAAFAGPAELTMWLDEARGAS